jgi:hypothetical protein
MMAAPSKFENLYSEPDHLFLNFYRGAIRIPSEQYHPFQRRIRNASNKKGCLLGRQPWYDFDFSIFLST